MKVDGLHHVTAITPDTEASLQFYGWLIGLGLGWQGVNADDPEMRDVVYGDERGRPGSIVTFFDTHGVAPGRPANGMAHRLLLRVNAKTLDFWAPRLARAGVAADRVADLLLAGMFVAAFVGLSLPVVGVGITLSRHVSPRTQSSASRSPSARASPPPRSSSWAGPRREDGQLLDGAPILPAASPVTT